MISTISNVLFANFWNWRWQPDVLQNSYWFTKLINITIRDGKVLKAEKFIFGAVIDFKKKYKKLNFLSQFLNVVNELKPAVGISLRGTQRGKKSTTVPIMISDIRSTKIALRWILVAATMSTPRTFGEKISFTMLSVISGLNIGVKGSRRNWFAGIQDHISSLHWRE